MKKIINNLKLICGGIGLWFHLVGLWIRRNWKMIIISIILLAGIAFCIFVLPHNEDKPAYYIDWSGHQGVAIKCWSNEAGLFCEKQYGGIISVQQYWEVSP